MILACFNAVADIDTYKNKLSELESQGIANASDPKIKELYEKLKKSVSEYDDTYTEYTNALSENARAMKDKEQSTENKLLGGMTMAATGAGGQQLASGLAEKQADEEAEAAMRAYLATFTCKYGDGQSVAGGTKNVEIPGGNELIALVTEYKQLAADLKIRKQSLGLQPGIESKEILDSATANLYDDVAVGASAGAFTSLSRALTDPTGKDAAAWNAQKEKSQQDIKTGATVAGIGALAGIVGNIAINKDAPQESSEKIKNEYKQKKQKIESDLSNTETELNSVIDNNKQKIDEYNQQLTAHKDFVATVSEPKCKEEIQVYINQVNQTNIVTDAFTDPSTLTPIDQDINELKAQYNKCKEEQELARKQAECAQKTDYEWKDNQCIKKEPEIATPVEQNENVVTSSESETDEQEQPIAAPSETTTEDQCPDENPRLRSLNSTYKVGDFCSYGDVVIGTVSKVKSGKNAGTCTCIAEQCKTGFHVSGGVCKKTVADKNGVCLRTEHEKETGKNDTTDKCLAFCKQYATDNKCTHKKALMSHNTNKCICNPSDNDLAIAKQIQQMNLDKNRKFYHVCKYKGSSGGKEYCIDEPFNWTQVQMLQATALAEEYALVKNKHEIVCENTYDTVGNDDYIACTSKDNKHYYNFKFDDVIESEDAEIGLAIRKALCQIIHGGELQGLKNAYMPCKLDKSKHSALTASAKKFGIETKAINNNSVGLKGNVIKQNYTTKKISGIDSRYFYSENIQIRANGQMIDGLYSYVASQLTPREITKFTCDKLPTQQWTIDGKTASGASDDVLTCYIDGTPVDFVFDDLSEARKRISNGGYSNMNCSVLGGTYNGHECMNVGELECERIQKMSADPTIKLAKWNPSTKRCELPAAATATKIQKATKISIMVGGVILGVVVTVATGGTGAPALALLAVETAGGIAEIGMTVHIDNEIVEFLDNSQKCREPKCAEQMLKENMQRMSNFSSDMTNAQIKGVDSELARLANIIPKDSDFYIDLLEQGTSTSDNAKGFFDWDAWEPEQVWRAVFVAVQLASVVGSIGKWVLGKSRQLVNATKALRSGIGQTADTIGITKKMSRADAKKLLDSYKNGGRAMTKKAAATTKKAAAAADADLKTNVQNIKRVEKATGLHGDDAVRTAEQVLAIDKATKDLDNAKTALQKRLDWEAKQSPGALKNDLQNPNSNGRIVRENVRKMEKQLADLGEEVTPMEFRSVDDILGTTPPKSATPTAPETSKSPSTDTPKSTSTTGAADDVADANKATDGTPTPKDTETSTVPETGTQNKTADNPKPNNPTTGARTLSKAEKIEQARASGNLGYHGTDADIAMDDMIRSSANTSDQLGDVGYGIAKDYDAAEKYAVKRLIERQNTGNTIDFMLDDGVLVVVPRNPLNLGNKTGYVYTTAKEASVEWTKLSNMYVGAFDAAQMPNSVEVLAKKSFNLDDLIRSGKVRIEEPISSVGRSAENAAETASRVANNAPLSGSALRNKASSSFDKYLNEFKQTNKNKYGLPKSRLSDTEWTKLNSELAPENIRMVEYTGKDGKKYMKFEQIIDDTPKMTVTRQLANKTKAIAKVNGLDIIDPSKLTGDDIIYYDLWKKYAPRNQSFDDFKAMGTLDEIQEMSKGWISWEDIEYRDTLINQRTQFLIDNKEAMDLFQSTRSFDAVAEQYPYFANSLRQERELYAKGVPKFSMGFAGKYSTFNPELRNFVRQRSDLTSLSDKIETTEEIYKRFLNQSVIDEVASLRAEQIDNLINSNPTYKQYKDRFYALTPEEKQKFATDLIRDIEKLNGVDSQLHTKVLQYNEFPEGVGASYRPYKDANDQLIGSETLMDFHRKQTYESFINDLSHEVGGHAIDIENPNAGALGAQLEQTISNRAYVESGENFDAYMKTGEEQTAYRIGATSAKTQSVNRLIVQEFDPYTGFFDSMLERGGSDTFSIYTELVDNGGKIITPAPDMLTNFTDLLDGKVMYQVHGDDIYHVEAYFDEIKSNLHEHNLDIIQAPRNGFYYIKTLHAD